MLGAGHVSHADVSNISGSKATTLTYEAIGRGAIGIEHPSVATVKRMLGRSLAHGIRNAVQSTAALDHDSSRSLPPVLRRDLRYGVALPRSATFEMNVYSLR